MLLFVGTKMVIAEWYKIPIVVSLGVIAFILAGSVVASLLSSAPLANEGNDASGSDDPRAGGLR